MPDKLHTRIKERRIELGLSQEKLALACNVGQSTVANWERGGHIPRQGKINKIAAALNTDEVWLISGNHSSNEGAVNRYLNTPIRHVPLYNWPMNSKSLDAEKPIGYVTMTIAPENVFALIAPKSGTEFPHETMLMFTKDYAADETGTFLEISEAGTQLKTSDSPPEHAEGRLIFSQMAH